MTPEKAYRDLADRVEGAKGPDRELDALVAIAFRIAPSLAPWAAKFPDWRIGNSFGAPRAEAWSDGELVGHWSEFAAYTASLDAAMTLVPEGYDWGIAYFGPRGSEAQAWPRGARNSDDKVIGSSDASVAASLTAAALRAHAARIGRGCS